MARITLHEYLDEARQRIEEGAYEDAIRICRHILQRYPRQLRTYQILGEACLEKGDFEEAADIFERLLQQADPENFVAHAGLGILREEQGRVPEAIWHMERAFEVAPNNDQVRDALRRLYGRRDGEEPTRIKHNKAALARLYLRGGQYRQAIDKLRDLLDEEENRERVDLQVALTEALWRDERREQAAEVARAILETAPNCLKAILILGMIHIEKGLDDQGHDTLNAARGLDPENRVAESLFGERSPLARQPVRVPKLEEEAAESLIVESAEAEKVEVEEPTPVTAAEEAQEIPVVTEAAPQPAEDALEKVLEQEEATEEGALTPRVEEPEPLPEQTLAAARLAEPAATVTQPKPEAAAPEQEAVDEAEPLQIAEAAEERTGPTVTATGPAVPPTPSPDVDNFKRLLEQDPKDDEIRLALARTYRDLEQIQPALEEYSVLKRSRADLLAEAVGDMERIVASRPDNLQAHELLADLYVKNGQLQQAVERYRWVLHRMEEKTAS
jgi:tetratricopeptide (TPR) repeat protein